MSFRQSSRGRVSTGFRPRIEGLENRLCLSVTVASVAKPNGTELQITGDANANTINVVDSGDGHVQVTDAEGKLLGAADNVRSIKLNAKGGGDAVSYTLENTLTHAQSLFFDLGAGKDDLNLDLSQGLNGANLKVEVEGGDGADSIDALVGSLAAARLSLAFNGGAGKDAISITGTELHIDIDSALVAHISGNEGADTIESNLSGQLLGRIKYEAESGKGLDSLIANSTITAGSTGKFKSLAKGGKGADTVTLNVIDETIEESQSSLEIFNAKIVNLLDKDTLTYTDNVTVVSKLA